MLDVLSSARDWLVGCHPFATGAAISHNVIRIEILVKFALLAETQHCALDGGESGGKDRGAQKITNDIGPETGERLVISSICCILATYRQVIKRNADAHAAQSFGMAEFSRIKGTHRYVRGVGPLDLG